MSRYSGIIRAGDDGTRLASLDLGDPARVHEAQARLGWQPATA